jgi:hypothetical protein
MEESGSIGIFTLKMFMMKLHFQSFRNITLMMALFFVFLFSSQAQNFLYEDFSAGLVPAAGWTIVGGTINDWGLYQTNNAGGVIPEMYYKGWNNFNGITRMVSPVINTSGYNALIIEWKHKILKSNNTTTTIRVETTSNGTTWNTVWSFAGTGFIGPETMVITVNNADAGSATFQFAFTVDGNTYPVGSFNSWRIDDISLDAVAQNDVSPTVFQIAPLIPDTSTINPRAVFKNWGTASVSFNAKVEIRDAAQNLVYSNIKAVNNVPSVSTSYVTFDGWSSASGTYIAKVITMLAGDNNPDNDTLTETIVRDQNVVWKKPLFEVFTSSTCGPCGPVNDHLDDILADNPGMYSLVKYPQKFPAPGDPYFIVDAETRLDYYGISGIPELQLNAAVVGGAISFSQFDFNEVTMEASDIKVEISENQTFVNSAGILFIEGSVVPFSNYPAGKMLRVAVVEKKTTGNVGNNGETEFHNELMVMLPDAYGTPLAALATGQPVPFSFSHDMTTTFVEELTDLALIVFIQDDATKEILQSAMFNVGDVIQQIGEKNPENPVFFPNPVRDGFRIQWPEGRGSSYHVSINDLSGRNVLEIRDYTNNRMISLEALSQGVYFVNLDNGSRQCSSKLIKIR